MWEGIEMGPKRQLAAVILATFGIVSLAGCATPVGPTTNIPPTSGHDPSESAEPLGEANGPSVDNLESNVMAVCEKAHETTDFGGGGRISGQPQVHERAVEPRWLVLIPAENQHGSYYLECLVEEHGVDLRADQFGTLQQDALTEDYLSWRINVNAIGA
ncbi:hypothetical protein [Microbacterium arborescens]